MIGLARVVGEQGQGKLAPRKSSVNAVFRRGGFTVGTVHARFSNTK